MADITKDDVRAYVKDLIPREFKPNNNENGVFSDNRNGDMDQRRDGRHRSASRKPFMEEWPDFPGE